MQKAYHPFVLNRLIIIPDIIYGIIIVKYSKGLSLVFTDVGPVTPGRISSLIRLATNMVKKHEKGMSFHTVTARIALYGVIA